MRLGDSVTKPYYHYHFFKSAFVILHSGFNISGISDIQLRPDDTAIVRRLPLSGLGNNVRLDGGPVLHSAHAVGCHIQNSEHRRLICFCKFDVQFKIIFNTDISLAARRIPVGWEMIQICQGCQSLQKKTYFKKNDGVTSQTLAVLRYSRWRSRWPTNYKCLFFSGTIDCTDAILVSSIGFSGSGNQKNIFNSFPNYHVTSKV